MRSTDAPQAATQSGLRFVQRGHPRSLAIGATFAVAWSPCIGPILGVVLTLAATSGTALQGALLLASFALGLGVWFLAAGASVGWLVPRLRQVQPAMPTVLAVAGGLLVLVGALMVLGEFARLNAYFQRFGFFFDQTTNAEVELSSSIPGLLGPLVAFIGGMLAFLSPCVLPLVPAYLANLAGEAALATGGERAARRHVLGHAAAFVIGFTLVFTVIGASAGLAGNLIQGHLDTLTRIGGVVLMIFGLQLSGLIHLPFLERTYQLPSR